ncbi:uncharacterized protein N7477_009039, partial [Penicillium maclennaniae]|uniref:uncharacterized protein n=1 Tax=Penicillium maclennaniae TaxID=1343394 RepID=UPI002541923D
LSSFLSSSLYEGEDNQPRLVPSSLKRSSDRLKTWVIFHEMAKAEFMNWWIETQIGGDETTQKKVQWDGKKQNKDLWSHFDQVAHYKTGEPRVICNSCGKTFYHPNFAKNGSRIGTSSLRRHLPTCGKQTKQGKQPNIQHIMQNAALRLPRSSQSFTDTQWQEQLIITITTLRLPFQIVEQPAFQNLIRLARLAPIDPEFPSRRTIQRRLQTITKDRQKDVLQKLPPQTKISISLDCWTPPFQ